MTQDFQIAAFAGDGVGHEVTPVAKTILDAAAARCGFSLKYQDLQGGAQCWRDTGHEIPPAAYEAAGKADAILLAAMGLPNIAKEWVDANEKKGLPAKAVMKTFMDVARASGATLHAETFYGANSHHIAESLFKGLARAVRQAVETDPRQADAIPSTKGTLGGGDTGG